MCPATLLPEANTSVDLIDRPHLLVVHGVKAFDISCTIINHDSYAEL